MRCVCVRCVCASLLLCVTQLNMKGEGIWVVRVGRLRSHNLCSHERRLSSLCPSLTHIFTWFSDGLVAVLP